MDTMIPYFILCALLAEALLVSGFPHQHSREEGKIMTKRTAGPAGGLGYGQGRPSGPGIGPHGQPTDPNASSNSQQGGYGGPPPFYPHGQPTDPNASSNSQQGGYGRPPSFGTHGQPTDPNASSNSQQGGYGGPPSFGSHGQPTDPNASSNSGSSGLVFPGVPAGPDGRPQSGGYPGGPLGPDGRPPQSSY